MRKVELSAVTGKGKGEEEGGIGEVCKIVNSAFYFVKLPPFENIFSQI